MQFESPQFPKFGTCSLGANRAGEMSGRATVRLLFIIACSLATFTDCARPLEDDEFSSVKLRLLETSQQIPRLPPTQLSPAYQAGNMFGMQRTPPALINEDYKRKSESTTEISEESAGTRSRVGFNRMVGQQHRKYTYSSMLHTTPTGPNPIGNEYRPGNTMHNVKKYRSPPQG